MPRDSRWPYPRIILGLVLGGLFTGSVLSSIAAGTPDLADVRYFRSDHGGTMRPASRLPADLNAPKSQLWRVPLDPGHSTPLVVRTQIIVTTHRAAANELAVESLALASGRPLWRHAISPRRSEQIHSIGSLATASPATDGTRIIAFFGSHGLMALDLDGRLLWEQRMGPFQDEYGAGSSPVIVGDRVILLQDHDSGSFLAAYDLATGRERWRTPRPDAVRSYSTPAVWTHNGRTELLVAGALELAGYNPDDGRRLWTVPGLARIVIPTPVPVGDTVFMASWAPGGDSGARISLKPWAEAAAQWDANHDGALAREEIDQADVLDRYFRMDLDQSGKLSEAEWTRHADVFRLARNSLLAIRPPETQSPASASGSDSVVWTHSRGIPYVATPVATRDAIWMVKDGGIVTRLSTSNGEVHYEERLAGQGSYYASPVIGDGKVFFASQQGVVTIVDAGPAWKPISSRRFQEKIHASPVLLENGVLIRTESGLYRFAESP